MSAPTITELWVTPILETMLDDHEAISNALLDLTSVDRSKNGPKFNLYDYFGDDPVLKNFMAQIIDHAKVLTSKYLNRTDLRLSRSWVSRQLQGDYNEPHKHFGVALAAVYYVSIPEGSGALNLYDPRGGDPFWGNEVVNKRDGRIHRRVEVRTGKLVIFPGYLLHSTEPHMSKYPRVVFATNIKVGE